MRIPSQEIGICPSAHRLSVTVQAPVDSVLRVRFANDCVPVHYIYVCHLEPTAHVRIRSVHNDVRAPHPIFAPLQYVVGPRPLPLYLTQGDPSPVNPIFRNCVTDFVTRSGRGGGSVQIWYIVHPELSCLFIFKTMTSVDLT